MTGGGGSKSTACLALIFFGGLFDCFRDFSALFSLDLLLSLFLDLCSSGVLNSFIIWSCSLVLNSLSFSKASCPYLISTRPFPSSLEYIASNLTVSFPYLLIQGWVLSYLVKRFLHLLHWYFTKKWASCTCLLAFHSLSISCLHPKHRYVPSAGSLGIRDEA